MKRATPSSTSVSGGIVTFICLNTSSNFGTMKTITSATISTAKQMTTTG